MLAAALIGETIINGVDRPIWQSYPNLLTVINRPVALSCSSSGTCLEVTTTARGAYTTDGGYRWREVVIPFFGTATSVSCPTTARCVVGGDLGLYATAAGFHQDPNSQWFTSPASVAPGAASRITAVACARNGTCLALGDPHARSQVALSSQDFGQHWRGAGALPARLTQVACVIGACVASDGHQLYRRPQTGGFAPSSVQPGVTATAELLGLSCTGGSFCLVALRPHKGAPVVALTSGDGGVTWQRGGQLEGPQSMPTAFSCTGPARCVAAVPGTEVVTDYRVGAGWMLASRDAGKSWQVESQPWGLTPFDVACTAQHGCWALATQTIVDNRYPVLLHRR